MCRRSLLISIEGTGETHIEPGQERVGVCPSVVTLFTKKYLTETDRCAGALS